MRNRGFNINHKTVQRLIAVMYLKNTVRKLHYRSYKEEVGKIVPNVLDGNFKALVPKWTIDITQINISSEKLYFSLILDMFNREIISYNISNEQIYDVLYKAFDKFDILKGLILLSDQGWQYLHYGYRKRLTNQSIAQSILRIESIFGCLKRIENKVNGLSSPRLRIGDPEVNNRANEVALQEIKQEQNTVKVESRRVLETLVMIKGNISDLLKRNSMLDKFMESLAVLKSEQQQNHERRNEFLEQFANTKADTVQQITEKMEPLSISVRNRMSNPDIVNCRHNISIDMPYVFWTIMILIVYSIIALVAFYFVKQPNYDRIDNDLKYRYIMMRGEVSSKQIGEFESIFKLNCDNAKIEQMSEVVEAYEDAVQEQAMLCRASSPERTGSKGIG